MSMTLRAARRTGIQRLQECQIPDPVTDTDLLLSFVTGFPRLTLSMQPDQPMTEEQERQFALLLLSRCQRIPLQYIIGTQWFYGRSFTVNESVLIPRPETELLCEESIRILASMHDRVPVPRVLDLCTGSGAIAITLSLECNYADVFASDLSVAALETAKQNANRLGASVQFHEGDLLEAVQDMQFDLIVSNPPYIPKGELPSLQKEVQMEPSMALDGGADGLSFYRRIAVDAPGFLSEGGHLALEIGEGQGDSVCSLLGVQGFSNLSVLKDYEGHERMVFAQKSSIGV